MLKSLWGSSVRISEFCLKWTACFPFIISLLLFSLFQKFVEIFSNQMLLVSFAERSQFSVVFLEFRLGVAWERREGKLICLVHHQIWSTTGDVWQGKSIGNFIERISDLTAESRWKGWEWEWRKLTLKDWRSYCLSEKMKHLGLWEVRDFTNELHYLKI